MKIKRDLLILFSFLFAFAIAGCAQSADLEKVLSSMDRQAQTFRSAQADFVWDQFTKVVNETETQSGTIYFRQGGKDEIEMAADVKKPAAKYVLFNKGTVKLYEPNIDRVTEYSVNKGNSDFQSFLVLGFGGSGHGLLKNFDVKYGGSESAMGVNTEKLVLTPKAQKMLSMFSQITLWIDPARGISVQQQFLAPDGDFRLAKYSNIVLNGKVSDDAFKLKTTGKTQVVRPQG
jgi:outer membrane lipoprotein-sorting protein